MSLRTAMVRHLCPLLLLALPLSACDGEGAAEDSGAAEWTVERDTIGDTIVVRTLGGVGDAPGVLEPEMRIGQLEGAPEYLLGDVNGFDVDRAGNVYLYDRQVPALRKYGPDGTYRATFGREGGGPGEYRASDGGVAVLPDGRVLLRDPGNARINVYSPEGEALDSWRMPGSIWVSSRLLADSAGNVYTYWRGAGMVRLNARGEPVDTLEEPDRGYDAPTVTARYQGSQQTWGVPFSPREDWTLSPDGSFVGGVNAEYAIDVVRPGQPVLRIGRSIDPVPVSAAERAYQQARVTEAMRNLDPAWKWDGPGIPAHKPAYDDVFAGRDGRLWVQLSMPGEEVPQDEGDTGAAPGEEAAVPEWREPVVFDVFEPTGEYVGQIHAPDGLQTYPAPVFDGDRVWAIVEDEMGVQYLTRFRLANRLPTPES